MHTICELREIDCVVGLTGAGIGAVIDNLEGRDDLSKWLSHAGQAVRTIRYYLDC